MDDVTLISDLVMSAGFLAVAALCGYRVRVQGDGPEFAHLRPILVSCLLAGVGCALRNFWSPAVVLCGVGMGAVACVLGVRIKAIVAQPTCADVQEVVARVGAVEAKVACLAKVALDRDDGSGPISPGS